MGLGALIVLLLIIGVVLFFFPVDPTIRNVILCIVVIAVILVLAQGFGWLPASHFSWR